MWGSVRFTPASSRSAAARCCARRRRLLELEREAGFVSTESAVEPASHHPPDQIRWDGRSDRLACATRGAARCGLGNRRQEGVGLEARDRVPNTRGQCCRSREMSRASGSLHSERPPPGAPQFDGSTLIQTTLMQSTRTRSRASIAAPASRGQALGRLARLSAILLAYLVLFVLGLFGFVFSFLNHSWLAIGYREGLFPGHFLSSPGWTRTNNPPVNSRMLCQLSYRGSAAAIVAGRGRRNGARRRGAMGVARQGRWERR
jgi:hypothetical protein